MPLTYHFKPFPNPGESHFTIENTSTKPAEPTASAPSCTCQKDQPRCKHCRQTERDNRAARMTKRQQSQASLSPVEEHTDPIHRQLTPKAIRDQRRAMSRVSVSAAFQSAVATEEYFPLYHSTAFARSNSDASTSSSRSRSRRRLGSGSASGTQSPTSRRSSSEQDNGASLPVSELAQNPVHEEGSEENDLARRGS